MKYRRSVVGAALILAAVFLFGCGLPFLDPEPTEKRTPLKSQS